MFNAPEVAIIGFDYLNATELEEMQRNLELLYSTRAGTCPGDRNFGLEQAFESCPANVARNLFALEAIEKTEIYGGKAEILDIEYTQAGDGNLTPRIIIGAKEPEDTEDADTEEPEG
ncbi:hypothetical protein AALC25_20420 [Lachnospiraceae bacterium 29-84]